MKTDLRKSILQEELVFPKHFASYIKKEYGILFYNEYAKESNDSNHAVLYPDKIGDFNDIIIDGFFDKYKETLEKHGYIVESYGYHPIMLLTDNNTIPPAKEFNIRQLFEWYNRIANDIFIPIIYLLAI